MAIRVAPYLIFASGLSDVGLVRQKNEDSWSIIPEERFFVLADGMGGHQSGEVASKKAVDSFCKLVLKAFKNQKEKTFLEAHSLIQKAIEEVNRIVYSFGHSEKGFQGMGTTLCCLYLHDHGLIYGHVGDSRIYRLRKGKLEQLTKDHSLLCELIDMGQIDPREAEDFLYKNIITKAIGTEPTVEPSVHLTDISGEDIYLLCSDGLSDVLSQEEIEEILNQKFSVEEMAVHLINSATSHGAPDNVTVIVVKVVENHAETHLSRQ